jgi:hypothetical protein
MKHARNVKVGVRLWLIGNVIVNKSLKIKGFWFKIYMEKKVSQLY